MAIVVSDTSPLRALSHLDLLELLPALFDEVLVPPAVVAELATPRALLPAIAPERIPFIVVRTPVDRRRVSEFERELDAGESESLALALEVRADALLVDEMKARAAARRVGLEPVGALAVLVLGKRIGRIHAVAPLIDRLQQEINFFVSSRVRQEVLQLAGEENAEA